MTWYGPNERWPQHPAPHWAQLLREARECGWHLQMFSDHSWGKISCAPGRPDAHEIVVYKSGRGGESFVRKHATRYVRSCRHHEPPAVVKARRLLDGAARLLDVAEALLDAADQIARALDQLEAAARGVDEADRLFDEAAREDEEARRRLDEAEAAATEEGVTGTPADLVDEADRRLADARRDLPKSPSGNEVRGLIASLRDRIAAIRRRLG